MAEIASDIRACAREHEVPGDILQIDFAIVGKTGAVTAVELTGANVDQARTGLRSCVKNVFEAMCFEPFTAERFKISFPFATR